jgi:hypothetical protein
MKILSFYILVIINDMLFYSLYNVYNWRCSHKIDLINMLLHLSLIIVLETM